MTEENTAARAKKKVKNCFIVSLDNNTPKVL